MARPATITWAAAVFLFSGGIALALGLFAFSISGTDRAISIVVAAVGAWGIATGVGLFRLRRWARMSALIAGGLCAYAAFTFTPMIIFLQNSVPADLQENMTTEAAMAIAMQVKIVLIGVFLFFGAIGFWWAYLFSGSTIKELFGISPTTAWRPFKFSVVGWFFIMNAALATWSFWRGVRYGDPMIMELGSLLVGWSALVVIAAYVALQLFLGLGLLRSREQSRRLTIYYLLFECFNAIVFLLRPGREARISAYYDMRVASNPTFDMYLSSTSWSRFLSTASIEWAVFALVAIWFLAGQNNTPHHVKS